MAEKPPPPQLRSVLRTGSLLEATSRFTGGGSRKSPEQQRGSTASVGSEARRLRWSLPGTEAAKNARHEAREYVEVTSSDSFDSPTSPSTDSSTGERQESSNQNNNNNNHNNNHTMNTTNNTKSTSSSADTPAAAAASSSSNSTPNASKFGYQHTVQWTSAALAHQTSTYYRNTVMGNANNPNPDPNGNQPPPPPNRCKIILCNICSLGLYGAGSAHNRNRRAMINMANISRSQLWSCLTLLCSFTLLFGQSIQFLACPKSWDIGFEVLFSITVVVLFIDIIFNCCLDPTYFLWYCRCCNWNKKRTCCYRNAAAVRGYQEPAEVDGAPTSSSSDATRKPWLWQFGSFMFWLDLISTISLLPEIRYINPTFFTVQTVSARINKLGLLIPEGIEGQDVFLLTSDIVQLFFTIGRTCRLARFVSASMAIRVSEMLNIYTFGRTVAQTMRCEPGELSSSDHPHAKEGSGDTASTYGGDSTTVSTSLGMGWRKINPLNIMPRRRREYLIRKEAATRIQRAWRCYREGVAADRGMERVSMLPMRKRRSFRRAIRKRASSTLSSRLSSAGSSLGGRSSLSKRRQESSQVGAAMRDLTARRVAIGIILALAATVLFTYSETERTQIDVMVVLHNQTKDTDYSAKAIQAARDSVVDNMYRYYYSNGTSEDFALENGLNPKELRDLEKLNVTVIDETRNTSGVFAVRNDVRGDALVELVVTIFILLIWMFGVAAWTGPVMTLVVTPIERMNRLLSMLTKDPLGYQSTPRYRKFLDEEFDVAKKTAWTEKVLMGMETSFLMSTILRIGSLMRVGFGSAGVEIIRNNLQQGSDGLQMNLTGSTVSCIFLFCDIRQFTDATEALQEEVFVFTNKIAAVVHSICNSYGGSANKNVGDAFLLSWRLDDVNNRLGGNGFNGLSNSGSSLRLGQIYDQLASLSDQADRALLSVVKICMALYNDDYYTEDMSEVAKERLMRKISQRKGPVVQMGFGLHAGRAVQGAIGSQRKIDPTYVSESVDRSETLESLTKRYGLKLLMSDAFHYLLSPSNRRRCRKIDQVLLNVDDNPVDDVDMMEAGETMELFTFDMDIDAWHQERMRILADNERNASTTEWSRARRSRRSTYAKPDGNSGGRGKGHFLSARRSSFNLDDTASSNGDGGERDRGNNHGGSTRASASSRDLINEDDNVFFKLPTGRSIYKASVWVDEDMRIIRKRYTDGLFYVTFSKGLQSYFSRDWEHARQQFSSILERFEDGPSKYFLSIIEEHGGRPPYGFAGYGTV